MTFWGIKSQTENKQQLDNVSLLNSTLMELLKNTILKLLAMLHTQKIK